MNFTTTKQVKAHGLSFELYLSEKQIAERVQALGTLISTRYAGKTPVFIGVLNGAYIFVADLMRACDLECEVAFVKLASYKGMESTGSIDTLLGLDVDLKGREVIIAEDIIDSGGTMKVFLETIAKHEPASVSVITLLLKPEALQHDIPIDHIGFEIPNKFVIGYGLDYNEIGRNLKGIYQLAKEDVKETE